MFSTFDILSNHIMPDINTQYYYVVNSKKYPAYVYYIKIYIYMNSDKFH